MENRELKSILQDALESEFPASQIDLLPKVRASLVAGTNQQGEKMNRVNSRRLSKAGLVISAVSALLVMALITPQGRAFAQKMIQFFAVSEDKSFPIPTEQVYPAPETPTPAPVHTLPLATVNTPLPKSTPKADESCSTPESQADYFCKIKAVEAQAGFNAKEFLYDPKNLKFSRADYFSESKEIIMEFTTGGGALFLRQGFGDFPLPKGNWGKVPADAVEQVTVNGQYGEIVLGTFVVYPNATEAVWEPGGQLSLAWREGDRWFSLEKFGDPYPIEWITKGELIMLAESLVNERPAGTIPPLDPENLESVEQAEALAGFEIPVPTLLPEGYELKRVIWADNVVRLFYGPKNSEAELFIFLGQGVNNQNGPCTECPAGVTETVQVGPWQGWYWRGAFNASAPAASGEPSPTPVWEGDYAHWSLTWNTDKYWISMFYTPPFNSGKEMNKETMIQIAESMK
jgi:hypothetical protein